MTDHGYPCMDIPALDLHAWMDKVMDIGAWISMHEYLCMDVHLVDSTLARPERVSGGSSGSVIEELRTIDAV